MCQADYSNIHLLPEEKRALSRYSKLDRIPDGAKHLMTFKGLGFVRRDGAEPDRTGVLRGGWYVVSTDGRRYLEYLKEHRLSARRDEWRFWITTAIAIAALIIAILK